MMTKGQIGLRIETGLVYGEDFRFCQKPVQIRDGLFTEPEDYVPEDDVLDASGCYVIPGLIDIHFHGCMDRDFCDGTMEAIRTLASYEAKEGITAICPATLTLPAKELETILSCAAEYSRTYPSDPVHADLVGINMEGPFISHVKKGAQNGKYIRPFDATLALSFLKASGGLVKMIGLAPEENPEFEAGIASVRDKVRVSLAHTNADYDTALRAFRAGASHVVHLYNAMPEAAHREPGVIGAAMDSKEVTAELICDGNHVHPSMVRAAFSMFGAERIVLISDSLRAAGMGNGLMMLGGQQVRVEGTRATLVEGGNLAGSVTNLMRCMRIAVKEMGIALEEAVRCATFNPARVIGADDAYGSISPGKHANAVLLDRAGLQVRAVIKDGKVLCMQQTC